jgi:hypothetical protein
MFRDPHFTRISLIAIAMRTCTPSRKSPAAQNRARI